MTQIRQGAADNKSLPPLTDDLVLLDSGLDSLAIAILVARLEETWASIRSPNPTDMAYPVTLGDFIRFYEHAAECPWRRFETALADAPAGRDQWLWRRAGRVRLDDVLRRHVPRRPRSELAGRSVVVATRDQFAAALALIELDGIARRR